MAIIGRETINPALFYSGKVAGYLTWIAIILSIVQVLHITRHGLLWVAYISYAMIILGLILTTTSMINLGSSTRLGLPSEQTSFKQKGLYRISRNPMYVGFGLLTLSSVIYHLNIVIAILGIYSIVIYHFIILGEERFLQRRFGREYEIYKSKVGRYI